jgi:hypothetical protein
MDVGEYFSPEIYEKYLVSFRADPDVFDRTGNYWKYPANCRTYVLYSLEGSK